MQECAKFLETFLEIMFIIKIKNELKKVLQNAVRGDLAKSLFCSLK